MSESFDWPFLGNEESMELLRSYGRVMFITRGLPGSGKSGVAEAVKEAYPNCKIIYADQIFLGFGAVEKTPETTTECHLRCQEKYVKISVLRTVLLDVRHDRHMTYSVHAHNFLALIAEPSFTKRTRSMSRKGVSGVFFSRLNAGLTWRTVSFLSLTFEVYRPQNFISVVVMTRVAMLRVCASGHNSSLFHHLFLATRKPRSLRVGWDNGYTLSSPRHTCYGAWPLYR